MYNETTLGKPINHYTLPHSKLEDLFAFRFEMDLSGSLRLKNIGKATCLVRFAIVRLYFVLE